MRGHVYMSCGRRTVYMKEQVYMSCGVRRLVLVLLWNLRACFTASVMRERNDAASYKE
jgi:hypothetical protein